MDAAYSVFFLIDQVFKLDLFKVGIQVLGGPETMYAAGIAAVFFIVNLYIKILQLIQEDTYIPLFSFTNKDTGSIEQIQLLRLWQ
jgi:hypothetical protein